MRVAGTTHIWMKKPWKRHRDQDAPWLGMPLTEMTVAMLVRMLPIDA